MLGLEHQAHGRVAQWARTHTLLQHRDGRWLRGSCACSWCGAGQQAVGGRCRGRACGRRRKAGFGFH